MAHAPSLVAIMGTAHVLDDYYLGITAIVTVGYQLFFFAIAYTFKFDKLTDLAGGSNFAVLAILTLALSGQHHARQLVASLFLVAWALRLSGFLFFRILRTGSDDRFDDKRDKFLPFLGFWVAQMLWVWAVSLPVTILNCPAVTAYPQHDFGTGRDVAGVVLFALGFVLESVSDVQKYRFRSAHDGQAVCDVGFFYFSRHPNYFGEIIIQFCEYPLYALLKMEAGNTVVLVPLTPAPPPPPPPLAIYMIAVSAAADGYVGGQAYKALYATILGPFLLTILLMFVSGLPLSERPKAKSRYEKGNNWEGYKRWLDRTSILIPFPPQLYERVPVFLKRTVFLEFPMYVFDPAKHSDVKHPGGAGEGGERESHEQAGTATRNRQSGEERLV
ncbi:oxidoreductase [Purpureocillium lavendulum]|uniref:Oxidoreductase n=1 Tax=Purpureocillium lavendulum TaxID=1247861 RepID=A0AB34FXH8_9HYPO|nr:oxidoreductase [Purpureocillium lavendulum]